jgi:hypothetical protein
MTDQPPPDGAGNEPRRLALPRNIGQTLQYLDDFDLEALQRAVEHELQRRRAEKGEEPQAPVPEPRQLRGPKGRTKPAAKPAAGLQMPTGKASLIRASYQAGMKPQAIARTLKVSLAQVNKVLAGIV